MIDQEAIRREYENMSYNEMSKRLSDSFKQLSEILGHDILLSDNSSISSFEEEEQEEEVTLSKSFLKSVSTGNVDKVNEFLKNPLLDLNVKDEDGTTALIYASCFGKFEIAELLVSQGAAIDDQDSHGWTALMWATTNNHEKIVKLLLENGASSETKSAKGRTVFDFLQKNDNSTKIADILATNPRHSISSTLSSTCSSVGDYKLSPESFLPIDNECKPKLIEEMHMTFDNDDFDYQQEIEFNWDRCMPDQMFVFSSDNLPYILDTIITNLTLPVRHAQEIFMPSNVIFLSVRFAHYFSSAELAEDVMEGALQRISAIVKGNTEDVHILSYWISNMTRLLHYLKKDAGLVVATAEYQLRLSELISETYHFIVSDIGRRIIQILEPTMLEYDPITDMEDVDYVDDWQRFFRRSSTSSSRRSVEMEPVARIMSPKTITQLFSSTFYVFQSYQVHSTVIIQALAQFIYLLNCELFNRMLINKKYLSRSKALQIRMNLSVIEDWVHQNRLPPSLLSYLKPSIQLTQLLQCLSQLNTRDSFDATMEMFDAINPAQIKRCVLNYRYETQEPRIPDEFVGKRRRSSSLETHEENEDMQFMLPFFVPTTNHHASDRVIPVIPEDWMEKLDRS